MGRWGPDARGRLVQAAMTLYLERGFEQTTVAEIAGRAGLTERTFFRHFADKREVLFAGSDVFQQRIADAVAAAPPSVMPMDAVALGLEAAGVIFRQDRQRSRLRQSIIESNAELQARELSKMAALSEAITQALRGRGLSERAARLNAEAGIVVFRTAFGRWVGTEDEGDWEGLVRAALQDLRVVMTVETATLTTP